MIQVKTFVLGDIFTNTYLLKDTNTSKLAVVDPACDSDMLIDAIKTEGELEYILLTHGHFDHIGGVSRLVNEFSAKVFVSKDEEKLLNTPDLNGSAWHNLFIEHINVDRFLLDNDVVTLGDSKIKFITTPGHTSGCGCFIVDDCIFSGDTLFCGSIGRVDFPTSSIQAMKESLSKLKSIDNDYTVYPGHGSITTLSEEKNHNPYMR